jgi:muramoyltetrapeptide carboxypeptidase LdcA involved in peptidoglycan recycling
MKKIYPKKLEKGDEIRVVAPSCSMSIISPVVREIANKRLKDLGFKISFGKNVEEIDDFRSSSIKSRVADLHKAFSDKKVKAVFAVLGGFNCNQLLKYLDWNIIKNNPKIFIGYSDTTALQNAIFAKTGLVTYSGPVWSTFGQKLHFNYTLDYFKKCLMTNELIDIKPTENWTDDAWYKDQDNRNPIKNDGWLIINKGKASGTLLGANLCTFNLLQGTEYMPDLKESVLFLEDDETSNPVLFDRDLQSLIHLPGFKGVRGIVIGRFQKASEMTNEKLIQIINTKAELKSLPVIVNVDFGHTSPIITFPIGGEVSMDTSKKSIVIKEHQVVN